MTVRLLVGDCRQRLAEIADGSIHCCGTSPPYFGLRSYLPDDHPDKGKEIGLEESLDQYIDELVGVFREVRRTLRDDGSLWLNLGDSYAGSWSSQGKRETAAQISRNSIKNHPKRVSNTGAIRVAGLKPKDLMLVPMRVAMALQADGWWLRSANIWGKANGMPESTKDRPTVAHEYVFQLTKSERYYYGYEDVRMPPIPESVERLSRAMRSDLDAGGFVISGGGYAPPGQPPHQGARTDKQRGHSRRHAGFNERLDQLKKSEQQAKGSALRSVWWLAPANFPGAHYAVMPDELAATIIKAGCPKEGVILDPFGGAGTIGLAATLLGRDAILIELNPENVGLARRRIINDAGLFANVQIDAERTVAE